MVFPHISLHWFQGDAPESSGSERSNFASHAHFLHPNPAFDPTIQFVGGPESSMKIFSTQQHLCLSQNSKTLKTKTNAKGSPQENSNFVKQWCGVLLVIVKKICADLVSEK